MNNNELSLESSFMTPTQRETFKKIKAEQSYRSLPTMDANVTFAMILIIWQTLAHKKESINKMLKQSLRRIKAL